MHWPDLGNTPGIHHGHAVTGFGDHAHVVGDQHHGGTTLGTDVLEQHDDLRLDGDIQRGGGLVRHDQLGLCGQRECNHHPLPHAARKLVRVMVNALRRSRYAGVFQQRNGPRPGLSWRHRQMCLNGFNQLPPDGVQRVERGQRVLKNRANLAAAYRTHLLVGKVVNALAFQQNLPAGHAPRRLKQADDGRAGKGFSGS